MTNRESAAIRVLLVSHDKAAVETLCDIMEQMGIYVEVCPDRKAASPKLCNSKYEGVMVDLMPGEDGLELLKSLTEFTSNKSAVSCALLSDANPKASAFQAGANFVVERPLNRETVARTIRAAYPMMVRERRRYFRCPVETPIFITCEPDIKFQANSVNISEAGMAILSPVQLKVGQKLGIKVRIPGSEGLLGISGEVCWANDVTGRLGIQFHEVSREVAEALSTWLLERLEEMIPHVKEVAGAGAASSGVQLSNTASKAHRAN